MVKYLLIYAICALTLIACEQQKQASAEVGAIPKTILNKATNDIKAAEALTAENQKTLENVDSLSDVEK